MVKLTIDLDADLADMQRMLAEVNAAIKGMRRRIWIARGCAVFNVAAMANMLATWDSHVKTLGAGASIALALFNVGAATFILWGPERMWSRAHEARAKLVRMIANYQGARAWVLLKQQGRDDSNGQVS